MGPKEPRLATALYRAALHLLPRDFRQRYGRAAAADFEAEARRMGGEKGRLGVAETLVRAVLDITWRAPHEWRRTKTTTEGWTSMWTRETISAARTLARRPGFAAVVVLTLALGIGANVAIFTVVNGILLQPLPFPDSERIVEVRHHAPGLELDELRNSPGLVNFYRELGAPVLESFALMDDASVNLTGTDRPERIEIARVTPSFFQVMQTPPALGRAFTEEEGQPGGPELAVITHDAWQSRFGGQVSVLGSTVELDGVATEIVGVMPEGFAFPTPGTVALIPERVGPDAEFGTFGRTGLARLAPGVDVERAQVEISSLQARLPDYFEELMPEFLERARWAVSVAPLKDRLVGDVRTALWIVLGTVGFVLLIACANVANLFLVRAEARQREVAIRAALGAGQGRIAGAFLNERRVGGGGGGVVGVALAAAGVRALVALGPQELPRIHEIGIDLRVLGFAAAISLAAGVALGFLPMLRYLGSSFSRVLRDGGRSLTAGRDRHRTRNVLVASQLALALVLLVGSGLMLRTFHGMRTMDVGVDPAGVLTVGLSVGEGRDRSEAALFYQQVVERVRALPGVEMAGAANSIPLLPQGTNGGSFAIRSRPRAEDDLPPVAMNVVVTEGHFESLGIPVLRGRDPTAADHGGESRVLWVNQAFARQFFDGEALGEYLASNDSGPWSQVVGVVGDVRHFRIQEDVRPLIYMPMGGGFQDRGSIDAMILTVETASGASGIPEAVRRIVAEADPTVPITSVRDMDQVVRESMAATSFTMVLLGIAAMVALLLGAVGIYGVISYVVSQRTREIGVRMALGARSEDVSAMVVRQGLTVSLVGIGLGLMAAFALTRLMESVLFGVSTTDPLTFAVVTVTLLAVATLASYLPARRASRVDPTEALLAE